MLQSTYMEENNKPLGQQTTDQDATLASSDTLSSGNPPSSEAPVATETPSVNPDNMTIADASQSPQSALQPNAPQGIFSSGDLAVNSENLEEIKPQLSEENKSRIASAFAQTDATQKRDQLSDQMADQDAISGTVLPAGAGFGSNTTASSATGDIRIPGAKKKSKAPLLILAALAAIAVVAGGVWWVMRNNNGKEEFGGTVIGAVNTTIIFDQTAPIPAIFGNSYGYISPDDGAQVISPKFLNAE